MILSLLLLLAAADPAAQPFAGKDAERFDACTKLIEQDAVKAEAEADRWRMAGGGAPARTCLGLAFAAQEKWAAAAAAFEQGAREAELQRDGRSAMLWVQAGNAALAGGDPGRARGFFDRALASPVIQGPMRGEIFIDRARAQEATGNLVPARADLVEASKLVPEDPMVWLLSANLARRQKDIDAAEIAITEALRLAPDDAAIAFEAGNVAAAQDNPEAARVAWQRAAEADPDGPSGGAARIALQGLDAPASPAPADDPASR